MVDKLSKFNYFVLIAEGNKSSEITEALLYFICKDSAPFSTVDGSGFRYFMKVACPLYKIPARNTVKNKLDDKYNYLSGKFKNMLKDKNNFTLTSDIWTDIQMKSYIGITIHFLQGTKFISGKILYKLKNVSNYLFLKNIYCI